MILYTNGDSHAAAAGAAVPYAYANDDIRYVTQGFRPHPDNLQASWSMHLSKMLGLGLKCDAESGSSNDRIIRKTREFLDAMPALGNPYTVMVIGWTSWETEEWVDEDTGEYHQITAAHTVDLPDKWKGRYRLWLNKTEYKQKESECHDKIWQLHLDLDERNIPHLFFNAMWHFQYVDKHDWNDVYLEPYAADWSYVEWAKAHGFIQDKFHFGSEAHRRWAELLAERLTPLLSSV